MKINFIKAYKVEELLAKIPDNLEYYRTGDFSYLIHDPAYFFETHLDIDEAKMTEISCDNDNLNEVRNCVLIYEALGNLTHYLARDERLWVLLTHTFLLNYTRSRWPIPDDDQKAIKHIKNHFFCIGARGIERDNAASRLWWLASLCSRVRELSFEEALTCFLHQSDVRANMVERPTTSQNIRVFSAILKRLHQSYETNKELFERERFRSLMKEINLVGGVRLLAALPDICIEQVLDQCIAKSG